MKKAILYFSLYLIYGLIAIITLTGFAILYLDVGFSKGEIGTLISIAFLGVLLQPLIGYACDVSGRKAFVLQIGSIIIVICTVLMLYFQNFILYLICVFLIASFRFTVFGILDVMVLNDTNDDTFTKIRTGATYGYALGVFALLPLDKMNNANIVLYSVMVCAVISIVLLFFVRNPQNVDGYQSRDYFNDAKEIIKNKQIIVLMFINMITIAVLMQKISYSNILFKEASYSMFLIALLNLQASVPEAILLPFYNKTFGKLSDKNQILLLMLFSMLEVGVFIFTSNIVIIFIFIGMQGLVYALQIPFIYTNLNNSLKPHVKSTGFLLNTMVQSIGSFLIGMIILTPLYNNLGIKYVFIALTVISLTLLIPYKRINNVNPHVQL